MIRIKAAPRFLAAGFFAAGLLAAAPAAAAERRFSITDFDRVTVEGPFQVRLIVGRPSTALVRGAQAGMDRVTVDSQGQTLRIRRNRNAWGGGDAAESEPVVIELTTRSLRSLRLIGPARIEVEGAGGLNLEFSLEGSGSLRATGVAADNLTLALLGAGRLEIAGTAKRLRADFQGSGEVAGTGLAVQDATVTTNTTGSVALTVNGPAAVNANGLGDVRILGRPACTVRGIGAAQVSCSNQRQDR